MVNPSVVQPGLVTDFLYWWVWLGVVVGSGLVSSMEVPEVWVTEEVPDVWIAEGAEPAEEDSCRIVTALTASVLAASSLTGSVSGMVNSVGISAAWVVSAGVVVTMGTVSDAVSVVTAAMGADRPQPVRERVRTAAARM